MLGLRECLERNRIRVTSALTPRMSTIDSFTLKRSLKLFRWGTIVAVYWGNQGTGPNENVSKLETDRQTKSARQRRQTRRRGKKRREKKSKRGIKKSQRTPCFRNNDFAADRKWCLSCCNIHVSDRTQGVSGLLHYLEKKGKGRNNQKCIRNNALFRLYPSLFRHPRSFTRSEWAQGGGRGACSRSHSQRGGWVIKLCVAL